ncbi:MAG: hypothetical protein AAGN66_05590 [Acidobacteriota bacterium]
MNRVTLGEVIAAFCLMVTTPYLMRVFFHVHHFEPWPWVDALTKVAPALGLGVAGTLGGAYIGATMLTHEERRGWLALSWGLVLGGMIYVISGTMVAEYTGRSLDSLMGYSGLWAHMVAAVLVPELAAVGSLVAAAVRRRHRSSTELAAAQRDEALADVARLRQELAATRSQLEASQVDQVAKRGGEVQPAVLQALKGAGAWLTIAEIAPLATDLVGREISRGSVRSAVARLVQNEWAAKEQAPVDSPERYVYAAAAPGQELPALPADREVA